MAPSGNENLSLTAKAKQIIEANKRKVRAEAAEAQRRREAKRKALEDRVSAAAQKRVGELKSLAGDMDARTIGQSRPCGKGQDIAGNSKATEEVRHSGGAKQEAETCGRLTIIERGKALKYKIGPDYERFDIKGDKRWADIDMLIAADGGFAALPKGFAQRFAQGAAKDFRKAATKAETRSPKGKGRYRLLK